MKFAEGMINLLFIHKAAARAALLRVDTYTEKVVLWSTEKGSKTSGGIKSDDI